MDIPVRHLPHDGQECPSYIMPGNFWPGAYLGHREQIDAYLKQWRDRARELRADQCKQTPPSVIQRLRKLTEQRVAG